MSYINKVLQYANEAVLPFYVLHQTVIVAIGFYVIKLSISLLIKYVVISTASLLATLFLIEVIVKRTSITRYLFGMRSIINHSDYTK